MTVERDAKAPLAAVAGLVGLAALCVPTCFVTGHASQAVGRAAADAGALGWVGLPIAIVIGLLLPAATVALGLRVRRRYMERGGAEALHASVEGDRAPSPINTVGLLLGRGRRGPTLIWFPTLAAALIGLLAAFVAGAMFLIGLGS